MTDRLKTLRKLGAPLMTCNVCGVDFHKDRLYVVIADMRTLEAIPFQDGPKDADCCSVKCAAQRRSEITDGEYDGIVVDPEGSVVGQAALQEALESDAE